MPTDIVWAALTWPSLEYARITIDGAAICATGDVVAVLDGQPAHVAYQVVTDADGVTRETAVTVTADGDTRSRAIDFADYPGCLDVDIAITPLTNTLPIRRLDLAVGASREIEVVYIGIPDLAIRRSTQRYTRLTNGYRYESGSFSADLEVDAEGLVRTYSNLWRRQT